MFELEQDAQETALSAVLEVVEKYRPNTSNECLALLAFEAYVDACYSLDVQFSADIFADRFPELAP